MKKRNYRKRSVSEDDSESNSLPLPTESLSLLRNVREVQKLRTKPKGVSTVSLLIGENVNSIEETVVEDPWSLKKGGLVDQKTLKEKAVKKEEGTTGSFSKSFAASTDQLQQDQRMLKYVEEGVAKVRGISKANVAEMNPISDAELYKLPKEWQFGTKDVCEDAMSSNMLAGIPEVDLGMEARIKNMRETELARKRMNEKNKAVSNPKEEDFRCFRFRQDYNVPAAFSNEGTGSLNASDKFIAERFKKRVLKR